MGVGYHVVLYFRMIAFLVIPLSGLFTLHYIRLDMFSDVLNATLLHNIVVY